MNRRSRTWCFTLNNYTAEEESQLLTSLNHGVSYLIMGKEVGEEGTPHLQGYLELSNKKSMRSLKTLLDVQRIHLEIRRGSQQQAIVYCKKEGNWSEEGTPMRQGNRTDLAAIQEEIKEGKTESDIAENHFAQWVVYRRSFAAYRNLLRSRTRREPPQVIVLQGSTGTGKTRYAYEQDPELWSWPGGEWFDGYTGQRTVLLDDFRGELSFGFLLRLLDRYPLQVPVKGGFTAWTPEVIYITSNLSPTEWYPLLQESHEPLLRRISEIKEF